MEQWSNGAMEQWSNGAMEQWSNGAMNQLDLSIIIVSYNTKSYLQECLTSVYDSIAHLTFEVIVIDNDSTDGSAEMVENMFPHVTLVKNTNEGFAKANNRGVAVSNGKYVLFLNPDTVVYPKVMEEMFAFMEHHQHAGAVTCRLIMGDGKEDYADHRGYPTPWNSLCYFSGLTKLFPTSKLFSGYTLGFEDKTRIHEIDALAGAFMFVRREAGEQVGWWDEDYFFNGEDIDFCYKLKEKHWKIYYIPYFFITHYNGVSGGTKKHSQGVTTANKETKKFIHHHRFNAMKIFYQKHYQKKYPRIVTWAIFQGISLKEWLTMRKL